MSLRDGDLPSKQSPHGGGSGPWQLWYSLTCVDCRLFQPYSPFSFPALGGRTGRGSPLSTVSPLVRAISPPLHDARMQTNSAVHLILFRLLMALQEVRDFLARPGVGTIHRHRLSI